MADVLVVGAGIAGLVGARVLERAGHQVTVLDKGHRPGGRMATRRPDGKGGPVFDHGAQFVTLRGAPPDLPEGNGFAAETERWRDERWVVEWFSGSPDLGSDGDGHPRYRGVPYQRGLAESLADELADVRCATRLAALRHDGDARVAVTADGEVTADAVLCTPPAPQTIALLAAGGVELPDEVTAALEAVAFDPCIAVLAIPSEKPDLPGGKGVVRLPDDDVLDLVADNHAKGISTKPAVTIHATGAWSRAHWDDPDETVGPALLALARDLLGTSADVVRVQRWRYSAPTAGPGDLAPGGSVPGPIRFAGDGFAGGRVEGAALSGWTAADRLLTTVS